MRRKCGENGSGVFHFIFSWITFSCLCHLHAIVFSLSRWPLSLMYENLEFIMQTLCLGVPQITIGLNKFCDMDGWVVVHFCVGYLLQCTLVWGAEGIENSLWLGRVNSICWIYSWVIFFFFFKSSAMLAQFNQLSGKKVKVPLNP